MKIEIAIISGAITLLVTVIGVLGNWYLSIQNKKKEIEQKEYQFLLENLKGFWEYQNTLYTETLKVVSVLVLEDDIQSQEFLTSYKRFWELYWSELPTCESKEISVAMVGIKDLIYDKKKSDPDDKEKLNTLKKSLKNGLLNLANAMRDSSILLAFSEKIKEKVNKAS